MRLILRALCILIAGAGVAAAVYVIVGRENGALPRPVTWSQIIPVDRGEPASVERLEDSIDKHGSLQGRVRQNADGTFDVSKPSDDHLVGRLAVVAAFALLGAFLLAPSPRRTTPAYEARR